MLGKADLVSNWQCQVVCCSETSHTRRAVHALIPEFRKVGFHLSLSDPVPDKFQVQHAQGSFRGLSRGVALASLFPVFSPRPMLVPDVVWASQRLLYSVIQVGQLPVHVVTLYLYPNAPLSGDKYSLNCKLVNAAVQIVSSINGLAVIAGDFNIHWKKFDDLVDLSYRGWKDSHEAESLRTGIPLENTCKQATRHTFLLCNPALLPFLRAADVSFRYDLDSHAVLRVKFDLPTYNPKVFKWLLPRSFDQCVVDTHSLESYEVPEERRLARKACNQVISHAPSINGRKLLKSRCFSIHPCPQEVRPQGPGLEEEGLSLRLSLGVCRPQGLDLVDPLTSPFKTRVPNSLSGKHNDKLGVCSH